MGTKGKPGKYDCLANLKEGEPFFVLRAQDRFAPTLVRLWAGLANDAGTPAEKTNEAENLADDMEIWIAISGNRSKTPD